MDGQISSGIVLIVKAINLQDSIAGPRTFIRPRRRGVPFTNEEWGTNEGKRWGSIRRDISPWDAGSGHVHAAIFRSLSQYSDSGLYNITHC
jgi:hypothetical protein